MMNTIDGVDSQAIGLDRRQMRAPSHNRHVSPGAVQPGGEVAADGASPVNADFHGEPSLVATSDARTAGRVKPWSGRPLGLGLEPCDPS